MKEKEMIFGIRAVIEAVEAGKNIDKVIVKRELQGDLFKELQAACKGCLWNVSTVTHAKTTKV